MSSTKRRRKSIARRGWVFDLWIKWSPDHHKCDHCGAVFGIAGQSTGSDEDRAADEYHDEEVRRHRTGECAYYVLCARPRPHTFHSFRDGAGRGRECGVGKFSSSPDVYAAALEAEGATR